MNTQKNSIPRAVRFVKEFRTGSSLPFLIEADDGMSYVVKLHGAGEGKLSMITGMAASRIAGLLGIPVLPELLIDFNPAIIPPEADPEIIDLAGRSGGINTATRFLPDAKPFTGKMNVFSREEKDMIFLTDLLLINIDRTSKNPNILCGSSSAFCYDYALSMSVRSIFEPSAASPEKLLPLLKRHIFWHEQIQPDQFLQRITHINAGRIASLAESLPNAWFPGFTLQELTEKLFALISSCTAISDKLDALSRIPSESDEEIRRKNLNARQAFMDKFGKI